MSHKKITRSEKMPARLLKHLTELAEVPRAEFLPVPECSDPNDEKKRRSFFGMLRKSPPKQSVEPVTTNISVTLNAALWMRVFSSEPAAVSFFIMYGDDSGEYAILVDEVRVTEKQTSVMLTSNVSINSTGKLNYVKACCGGLTAGKYSIDELFVQRVKDTVEVQQRISA